MNSQYIISFRVALFLSLFFASFYSEAKKNKLINLQDIWSSHDLHPSYPPSIRWMNNSSYYTLLSTQKNEKYIIKYNTETSEVVDTLLDIDSTITVLGYQFGPNEKYILISTSIERIYRRSKKITYQLINLETKEGYSIAEGKQVQELSFSPDGSKVAYVFENNIYVYELTTQLEKQLTFDGEKNKIINGHTDWVYEEEFGFRRAYSWSSDGQKIAYLRFDESQVPVYNMQVWEDGLYPQNNSFKYPKAGEKNSEIQLRYYDLVDNTDNLLIDETNKDTYLLKLGWVKGSSSLISVIRMNRLQNNLELLHYDLSKKTLDTIYQEESTSYIDVPSINYISNKQLIYTSDKSGYKHIYQLDISNKTSRQLTKGNWEVSSFLGKKDSLLYFISTKESPLQRQLYTLNISSNELLKLSKEEGVHRVKFSPDHRYYTQMYSNLGKAYYSTLVNSQTNKIVKVLESNTRFNKAIAEYSISQPELFSFQGPSGDSLNGYMIKPINFKKNKKYPVLFYVYGGPGSQTVKQEWGRTHLWYQYLAQQGYVIVSADNRGTGGRGREFKNCTYGQLGKLEVEDQIAAAKYISSLPYTDKDRVGIYGWSYGGYMSSLCILLGSDVFKTAIAVAPVTNWRYYDTIYSERFLKKPQDNELGYKEYSPVYHTDSLKGEFLLIHGTGDDNVHLQNSMALQKELIKSGKQFQSFYYPDKNHSIYGGNTRFHLYQMMTNFLLKNL